MRLDPNQLPPSVKSLQSAVQRTVNLYNDIRSDVMEFYEVLPHLALYILVCSNRGSGGLHSDVVLLFSLLENVCALTSMIAFIFFL